MPDREPEPSSRERCNPSQLFAAPPGEAGTYGAMLTFRQLVLGYPQPGERGFFSQIARV